MSHRWLASAALSLLFAANASAQDAPSLLHDMVGTWSVEQKTWPAPGAAHMQLPPAVAKRRLIDGKYLEESMEPPNASAGQPEYFSRNAIFNFNAVTKQFEYFSIDTRAPQVMSERSAPASPPKPARELELAGGTFLAAEWGPAKNVQFKYRLTISAVQDGKQTVQLFLTPETVLAKKEFLAFEYKYARLP